MIDSEAKAYWLGFIAADGSIARRGTRGSSLTLALGRKDAAHLARFKADLRAENPIAVNEQYARISLWGPSIPDALERHGVMARKSLTQPWPDLAGEMLRHFLRGYFDGDGHIGVTRIKGKTARLQLTVIGSVPFIARWRDHFEALGARRGSLVHPRGNRAIAVVHYGGDRQIRLIHDHLYRDATVALARKAALPVL